MSKVENEFSQQTKSFILGFHFDLSLLCVGHVLRRLAPLKMLITNKQKETKPNHHNN